MKLVDLGGSEITESCQLGNVRAAWAYWRGSRQWQVTRSENRVVLIEGQPDRFPQANESIERWLEGRSGSFRGFEIAQDRASQRAVVRVFTDPLCTRPVYYLISDRGVCIADKLSTVVLNAGGPIEADWGGLLEGAILASLYSHKTTVKNAVWMEPGQALEFEGATVRGKWKNALPQDVALTKSEVTAHPAETLRFAIEKAISETWTDPETRLLLSGGLDSRILLSLAQGKRKTLTLELYSDETEVAKRVAQAAGSDLDVVPAPDYSFPMSWAYLVTGSMHDSKFVTHLGLVKDWRERGIPGITHGYFHNTMYRGWTAGRYERFPARDTILFELMGRNAYYFDKYGCKQSSFQRQFYGLLSADGQAVLSRQLRELSDSMTPVMVDGYDLTFEHRLMDFVPRQIFFCCMLAWYEALDVASPVFQPALWTWYALSSPRVRDRDWAIREVFLTLDHPAARLPDSNTGQPIAHLKTSWQDKVRNQPLYAAFRAVYKKLFWKPMPFQQGGLRWGDRFREPATLAALEDGVSVLRDNPFFDRAKVEAAMDAYRKGQNEWVDSICALTSMGQWQRLVSRPESLTQHVRAIQSGTSVNVGQDAGNPQPQPLLSAGESARV
jgi:hypothetical protein